MPTIHQTKDEQELFARIFMFRNSCAKQNTIIELTPLQRAKYNRWSKEATKTLMKWKEKLESESEKLIGQRPLE